MTPEILICSFGFQYGPPADAELQFDVRGLPNPYYVPELKCLCGLDAPVADYVFSFRQSQEYLAAIVQVVQIAAQLAQARQQACLKVYVGCTGGQHRSVATVQALGRQLQELGWVCHTRHRELERRENATQEGEKACPLQQK